VIVVSTVCLSTGGTLAKQLDEFRCAGVEHVELGGGVRVDGDWLRVVKESGMPCILHGYYPPPKESFVFNLSSSDAGITRLSMDHVRAAIDYSEALGAPFYSMHSGFVTDPIAFDGSSFVLPEPAEGDMEAARERFSERMLLLLEYSSSKGIGLLVENNVCLPQHRGKALMQTADEIVTFLEEMACDGLGLLLDTGHLGVSGETLGFCASESANDLTKWVGAVHLHTNDGHADQHLPIAPNGWEAEWVRQLPTDIPIVIEAHFDDTVELRTHHQWLRQLKR